MLPSGEIRTIDSTCLEVMNMELLSDLWIYNSSEGWIWIAGSNQINQNVSISARYVSVTWMDTKNQLWLFGGLGYPVGGSSTGFLNDLWRFNGNEWIFVRGSNLTDQAGQSGGSSATPGATVWTVSNNFWLFGGSGISLNGGNGILSDLWSFNGTNWIWVSGPSSVNSLSSFPLSRYGAIIGSMEL